MPISGSMMSANITAASNRHAPHRLQGHLRAELRLAADLDQAPTLAQLAVFRQDAPGLAHEPDRRALDRLASRGAQEEVGFDGSRHGQLLGSKVEG